MHGELATTKVIIHPLVLLSIVDQYTQISEIGNEKRVVVVLFGS
jgi:26S proteasome regulatory subunit N8